MLGKTAGGLFWMFRYLERTENTARLLDAGLRIAVTKPDNAAGAWKSIIRTADSVDLYLNKNSEFDSLGVTEFLLRDANNGSSVLASIDAARRNARMVRTALTREVWEATNEAWMTLHDLLAQPISPSDLPDALNIIRKQSALVRGALHGTMLRNDIFDFAQIGFYLERADNTARILDIKYFIILPEEQKVGSTYDALQWETVLRSVSGQRAYRMLHTKGVSAARVASFVMLDRRLPRSLAFCTSQIASHLERLAEEYGVESEALEQARVHRDALRETDINAIISEGLHEVLQNFIQANDRLSDLIGTNFRFYA